MHVYVLPLGTTAPTDSVPWSIGTQTVQSRKIHSDKYSYFHGSPLGGVIAYSRPIDEKHSPQIFEKVPSLSCRNPFHLIFKKVRQCWVVIKVNKRFVLLSIAKLTFVIQMVSF